MRIIVVADDNVNRIGLTAILASYPEVEVEVGVGHHEAASRAEWSDVDVVVVDADDPRSPLDQFPGVATVESIRRKSHAGSRPALRPRVIAMTNEILFDDALRIRMREAGADALYHRASLGAAGALYAAAFDCSGDRPRLPEPSDLEQLVRLGVSRWTRVNAGIRFINDHSRPLVDGRVAGPRSRAWLRWRRQFNEVANLNPATADGLPPERNTATPSLPQIFRFYQWATRMKPLPLAEIPLAS